MINKFSTSYIWKWRRFLNIFSDGFKVKDNDEGISVTCDKYGNKFQKEFHRMWKEQILCDATIMVSNSW